MSRVPALAAAFYFLFWTANSAWADEKKFTFSYEAKTLPQGTWEWEHWMTLQTGKNEGTWNTLKIREEFEYGFTDRLSGSIYLNFKYQSSTGVDDVDDKHFFTFDSVSTEWKFKVTDPSADFVGFLLYEELLLSNTQYELETKLVLSKDLGPVTIAYNFVWEAVLNKADDPNQSPQWTWEHEISNTFGISYGFTPHFAIGLEGYDIYRYDAFAHTSTHADYVGPNIHVAGSWGYVTLTVLHQVSLGHGFEYTDDDNTKWQIRLIIGIDF